MAHGAPPHPDIVFVSNGHGEDVVGARIALALAEQRPGLRIGAVPLVGTGEAYSDAPVELLGPRAAMPSGGLLLHSLPLFWGDLRAGFVGLTYSQLRFLAGLRCSTVVTVGDLYAQMLSSLVRARSRFVVQTLVSAYHADGLAWSVPHRVFMERITLPERLLMRHRAARVYVRDAATESKLRESGLGHARFLGNPIVDGLAGPPPDALAGERRVVALLPGSRGYRDRSLAVMLGALESLGEGVTGALAWTGGPLAPPPGWSSVQPPVADDGLVALLQGSASRVLVYEGRFAAVLNAARVVMGTSGTANEQAVALGRPVVAFPVPPYYTAAFVANQKRLLGPALAVVDGDPGSVAGAVRRWLEDPALAEREGGQGRSRLGGPGGSAAIAADILTLVTQRTGPLRGASGSVEGCVDANTY